MVSGASSSASCGLRNCEYYFMVPRGLMSRWPRREGCLDPVDRWQYDVAVGAVVGPPALGSPGGLSVQGAPAGVRAALAIG